MVGFRHGILITIGQHPLAGLRMNQSDWMINEMKNVCVPVAEPEFVGVLHLICKLDALISFDVLVEGKTLCVGEGDGDGDCDGERLKKLLIGSAVGNVSLICGDFLAVGCDDGVSSISNYFC